MKTINLEQSLKMGWCYNEERLREIAGDKEHWSALDILALECIPTKDRLFAVLDERLIDAHILHELACRCAKRALERVEDPDPRREWQVAELIKMLEADNDKL